MKILVPPVTLSQVCSNISIPPTRAKCPRWLIASHLQPPTCSITTGAGAGNHPTRSMLHCRSTRFLAVAQPLLAVKDRLPAQGKAENNTTHRPLTAYATLGEPAVPAAPAAGPLNRPVQPVKGEVLLLEDVCQWRGGGGVGHGPDSACCTQQVALPCLCLCAFHGWPCLVASSR